MHDNDDMTGRVSRPPTTHDLAAVAYAVRQGNVYAFISAVTEEVCSRFPSPIREPETDEDGAVAVPDPDDDREAIGLALIALAPHAPDSSVAANAARTAMDALETASLTDEARTHLFATIEAVIASVEPNDGRCGSIVRRYLDRGAADVLRADALPPAAERPDEHRFSAMMATDDALARSVKRYIAYCITLGIRPTADEVRTDRELMALPASRFNAILTNARTAGTPFINPRAPLPEDADDGNEPEKAGVPQSLTDLLVARVPAIVAGVVSQCEAMITNDESSAEESISHVRMFALTALRRVAEKHGYCEWRTDALEEALDAEILRAILSLAQDE